MLLDLKHSAVFFWRQVGGIPATTENWLVPNKNTNSNILMQYMTFANKISPAYNRELNNPLNL